MALINSGKGAPITITVGRRGERPDFIPARIVGDVRDVTLENGRNAQLATVITYQATRDGELYLGERQDHNLAFAFDRFDRVEALDGTNEEPKSWQELVVEKQRSLMEFLMKRPSSEAQTVSVEDVP